MNKPRVALIALHFAEYSAHLALALREKWDVLLVLYRDNAENELGREWRRALDAAGLRLVVLEKPDSVFSVIGNALRIVAAIKAHRAVLVHCQEGIRDELVVAMLLKFALPLVLTVHDPTNHTGTDSRRMRFSRYRLYRPLLRRMADVAITHGHVLADELAKASTHLRNRVRVIAHGPLGVVGSKVTRVAQEQEIRMLFFGRIHEYKGLHFFVESVIALHDRGFPIIGVVAGRGGDLQRHRQRMMDAGCFEILDRYIAAADLPDLFLGARAVVLPYTQGTQSGVAAMALGYGRPVIASAVGSIPELVVQGVNGLLVPPSDQEALTRALELIASDDRLCDSLAAGARDLRDGALSWKTIAEETGRVYAALIGSGGVESQSSGEAENQGEH